MSDAENTAVLCFVNDSLDELATLRKTNPAEAAELTAASRAVIHVISKSLKPQESE